MKDQQQSGTGERLFPVEQLFFETANCVQSGPDEIRRIPAVTFKMASILRTRLVELCGEPSDPEGPMDPPTIEEIAVLIEEELSFTDLVAMLRDAIERNDYCYPHAVVRWVGELVNGDHQEGPHS